MVDHGEELNIPKANYPAVQFVVADSGRLAVQMLLIRRVSYLLS